MTDPDYTLPSEAVCNQARKVWKRIQKRFELSNVWRLAPSELIATEFLSLIRFVLAPLRVECAIYDSLLSCPLLAATLPDVVFPDAGDNVDPNKQQRGFATAPFFESGGAAARQWWAKIAYSPEMAEQVEKTYADHFVGFGEPDTIYLNDDKTIYLRLLVSGPYATERLSGFVSELDLASLLRRRPEQLSSFQGEWQSLSRRLTDYLLHEFIDRLENDLAVVLDSEAPEIWVLLMDDQTPGREPSLQFHTSPHKLRRILLHYNETELHAGKGIATIGSLRRRVEAGLNTGDFARLLARCDTKYHQDLVWNDSAPATERHLECIAEKFRDGWPSNRGIAGTVVSTGCSEVIREFSSDYRVQAYEYEADAHQLKSETDRFYHVRLAERIFIKTKPHVIELPLLWSTDDNGRGRCTAILLVLFNGDEHATADYFARRALDIRAAIEPWHILFEQHGRLMEWNRVIHGHIVHEARNEFQQFRKHLNSTDRTRLENRLEALWAAYSFVPDYQGSARKVINVTQLVDIAKTAAETALMERKYKLVVENQLSTADAEATGIETVPELIDYLISDFLEDSASSIANLVESGAVTCGAARIVLRVISGLNRHTSQQTVTLQFEHRVTPAEIQFLRDHETVIGRQPVFTRGEGRECAHLGLFYAGALLRGCGGEFQRPILDNDGKVQWNFVFPVAIKPPATGAS